MSEKKVWEEEWSVSETGHVVCDGEFFVGDFCEFDIDAYPGFQPIERERARLAAAAPDLVRVLLAVEWPDRNEYPNYCTFCFGHEPKHEVSCQLDAALRKAGVREPPARAPVVDIWRKGKEAK